MCCDEGSSLVRLFGQVDSSSKEDLDRLDNGSVDVNIYADVDVDVENLDSYEDVVVEEIESPRNVINGEIESLSTELNKIQFSNKISIASTRRELTAKENPIDQESVIYDLSKKKLFQDLQINLGSNTIPRFSCACHKLNIVIQSSIENPQELKDVISKLSSFAGTCRNSISISNVFSQLKCRPKIENKTRWFSRLYVLLWAQKAYLKQGYMTFFY